jgi:hypothetical protein
MPSRFEIAVQGAWLYDPRLDPTYGTGTQDFSTPSTWAFNNGNAALVLLRFLIGEYSADGRLLWGRGALEADIDMDSFIAAANLADETLDGIPRFRLGGFHLLDGDWGTFVKRWEEETGGKLRKDAQYRVWLPNDDLTPLTTLSEADLLAGASIAMQIAGSVDSLFNCARGRYIEPADGYLPKPYEEISEASAITEDGGRRVLSQDFSWVQDLSIAQRIARYKVRRSRFQRLWTFPLGWKGQHPNYRPFTVHTLNCEETGGEDQTVRVVDRRRSFGGATVLLLQQEDASIYDDTLPLNDPLASDEIPARIDRLATFTARTINLIPEAATSVYTETNASEADLPLAGVTILSVEDVIEPLACVVYATLTFDVSSNGDSGGFLEFWGEIDGVGVVALDPNPRYVMSATTDARLTFQFQFEVTDGQMWSIFFEGNSNVSPIVDVLDARLEVNVIRR